jgi:serine/threonine-protein kinase
LARLSAALGDRYRLEREVGAGGMATVFLAEDLRHHRRVALKVLRPELSALLGSERFLKEIEVTANLQHPHILPLFDSGEAESLLFYVMPFIEGESLRARLTREKQLTIEDAVRITREVAGALDYAHRHGVIHRDIKPENILLHERQALVSDFGIAIAIQQAGGHRLTETGLSLGTPQYMSPEQATADRELDARSDVYSLGCVLYEMIAGEPPHTGPTAQAVIAALLTEEPRPVSARRKTVPPALEAAVHRALAKLPPDRFQSAAAFGEALGAATSGRALPATVLPVVRWPWIRRRTLARLVPWVVAGVAVIVALSRGGEAAAPAEVVRAAISIPRGQPIRVDQLYRTAVLSPDGSKIVYAGSAGIAQLLLERRLDRLEVRAIPGTEGGFDPFFSPDGQWIGFFAGGKLKKVALGGGPAMTLADADAPRGGTWLEDGSIVYAPSTVGGLHRVSADGGTPQVISTPDTAQGVISHRWPAGLPGGRAVIFTTFTGLVREGWIAAVRPGTSQVTRLVAGGTRGEYAASGHLVYVTSGGVLQAAPFDLERLETTGAPVSILEGILTSNNSSGADFSLATNGTLAYITGGGPLRSLVRVDRDGTERVLVDSLPAPGGMRFSPDGSRIAMELHDGTSRDIWTLELRSRTLSRLTFEAITWYPAWSPRGDRISYASRREGSKGLDLMVRAADGSGGAEVLYAAEHNQYESLWTPDGRSLVIRETAPGTGRDLVVRSFTGDTTTRPFLVTTFDERAPAISPDGRLLAYVSTETGRAEVYVRPFPDGRGKWQISTDGGTEPVWGRGGRELFYRAQNQLMSAAIQTTPAFSVSSRRPVLPDAYTQNPDHTGYDVHPSEGWFVFTRARSQSGELVLVLNWLEELRARIGGRN